MPLAPVSRIAASRRAQFLARLRSGSEVGLAEIFALEKQRRPVVLRHCVSKAVAQVELCGMPASLAAARKSRERRMRLLVGDRYRPDSREPEKFANVLLSRLDARMPFPRDPQGGLEDRDRRSDG